MPDTCTVLIGAAELLPALRQRAGDANGDEVLSFSDTEALRALEAIHTRRPRLIALERLFSVSPRGTALINRIKADASLRQAEIRVFAHDSDYTRLVRHAPTPQPMLDERGTRRAPRFKIADKVHIRVESRQSALVDLSTCGAHILSPGKLSPNQTVAVEMKDDIEDVRCRATVAWTKFEMSSTGVPAFRSGIDFIDAEPARVDAFCVRHRV